jgi:hypothetical protein
METKNFDLGTILSIITPILLTDIGNVYEILNYMTGESLMTHQLPRVCKECASIILQQYPQLTNINSNNIDTTNWKEFLDGQIERFGNSFEIIPVGLFEHKYIDPIQEAIDLVGEEKISIFVCNDNKNE